MGAAKANSFVLFSSALAKFQHNSCHVLLENLDLPACLGVQMFQALLANFLEDFLSRTGLLRQQPHSILWSQFIIWTNRTSPSATPCISPVIFSSHIASGWLQGADLLIMQPLCSLKLLRMCWQMLLDQFSVRSWSGMLLCDSHVRISSGPKGKRWVSGTYSWTNPSKGGGSTLWVQIIVIHSL